MPDTDVLWGIHVTSDPSPVYRALERGLDISRTRARGKVGDLGSAGLYFSQAPQIWAGRAEGKCEFLKTLGELQRIEISRKLEKELRYQRHIRYISEYELESALRDLGHFEEDGYPDWITRLAGQPYNIRFWEQEWLEPLGIRQKRPPVYVEVEAEGLFADLTDERVTPGLIRRLKRTGYDGAFNRGSISYYPQSVVWNTDAIVRFGDWTAYRTNPQVWEMTPDEYARAMTYGKLCKESYAYREKGAITSKLRDSSFQAAFMDMETGYVYPMSGIHNLLELPDEVIVSWQDDYPIAKPSLVSGFVDENGYFYTRDEIAGERVSVPSAAKGHRRIVKQALRAGYPVPGRVLKHYPDLR